MTLLFRIQRMFRLGADPESTVFKHVAITVHCFAVHAHTSGIKDAIDEATEIVIMPGTVYYENTLMTKQLNLQFTEALRLTSSDKLVEAFLAYGVLQMDHEQPIEEPTSQR